MRSGLLCRRRRASSSSASACCSKCAISAARCARALGRLAEAVQLEPDVPALDQAEVAPERAAHQDLLGVDVRAGVAERLDVDLVELAVAALLRPLVAEHRHLRSTGAAARCRARCARSSRARCRRWPRDAASAGRRSSRPRRSTSPSRRCRSPRRGRARTAPSARRSACARCGSRSAASARAPCPRTTPSAPIPAAGCRSCL